MKTALAYAALATACLLAACGDRNAADPAKAPEGAAAPAAGAEVTIKARQANLKKFGAALKAMNDELKKPEPSVAVFQTNAPIIAGLAPDLPTWFPAGTGAEAGVKTAAKPEIWAQPDEFKAKAAALAAEAAAFAATAQAGDLAAIREGVPKLGGTCRSCHQQFRVRDE